MCTNISIYSELNTAESTDQPSTSPSCTEYVKLNGFFYGKMLPHKHSFTIHISELKGSVFFATDVLNWAIVKFYKCSLRFIHCTIYTYTYLNTTLT